MTIAPSQLRGPIVVAGHACLDLTPAFPPGSAMPAPGGLAEMGPMSFSPGGAVSNTGGALAKLGAPVRMIARAGDDLFGGKLHELLAAFGAEVRLAVQAEVVTSYSVVLAPAGKDRSFLHAPASNHSFLPSDVDAGVLADAVALHFGYPPAMRGTYEDGGEALAAMFARAGARRAVTSLDLCSPDMNGPCGRIDWRAFFKRVLPGVTLFCPGIAELRELLGTPHADERTLAREMLDLGCSGVLLKLGERGVYFRSRSDAALPASWRGRELLSPCYQAAFVNASGAGDCTIAGLLCGLLCGYDCARALNLACAVGAFSVEAESATGGVRTWGEVLDRMSRTWPRLPGVVLPDSVRVLPDGIVVMKDDLEA